MELRDAEFIVIILFIIQLAGYYFHLLHFTMLLFGICGLLGTRRQWKYASEALELVAKCIRQGHTQVLELGQMEEGAVLRESTILHRLAFGLISCLWSLLLIAI